MLVSDGTGSFFPRSGVLPDQDLSLPGWLKAAKEKRDRRATLDILVCLRCFSPPISAHLLVHRFFFHTLQQQGLFVPPEDGKDDDSLSAIRRSLGLQPLTGKGVQTRKEAASQWLCVERVSEFHLLSPTEAAASLRW